MSDTIRIKLPKKSSEEPSPAQTQTPDLTLSRLKSTASKRRIVNSDADDCNDGTGMHEIETKAYGPAAKRARRSHSTVDEMEVDPPEASSAPAARTAKPKKASSGKKRRAAVLSSDDDDFVDAATHAGNRDRRGSSPLPSLDVSDGDYDYDLPAARSNPVRQKNPTWKVRDAGGSVSVSGNGNRVRAGTAAKGGGGMGASKIGKGKAVKKESKEITMKDERKGTRTPPVKRETSAPNGQARAQSKESQPQVRSRLQVKKEDKEDTEAHDVPLDIINDPAPSSPAVLVNNEDPMQPAPASVTVPAPAATLPKKIKLPTIRKNKAPSAGTGTGTGTSTPTQTQGKQPPALTSTTPGAPTSDMSAAPAGGTRKVPGTSDFDLRDKSAWASIFKQTGGSTPRSGLSRREKEDERRKELYKMRDEARTMREEGLKHTFDLQASWDKISRFEERLRANRSSALYPNLFAAKFRDEWAAERKKERDRERQRERERERMDGSVEMRDGRDERGYRDEINHQNERERRYP